MEVGDYVHISPYVTIIGGNEASFIAKGFNNIMAGFQIDAKGNINFPIIGKVSVVGKTIDEIRHILHDLIVKEVEG